MSKSNITISEQLRIAARERRQAESVRKLARIYMAKHAVLKIDGMDIVFGSAPGEVVTFSSTAMVEEKYVEQWWKRNW